MTLKDYRTRERAVYEKIEGIDELLHAEQYQKEQLAEAYPDAAFALFISESLFHHCRDLSEIHQRAYFSILSGEHIPSVRRRFERETDKYIQEHMWDD